MKDIFGRDRWFKAFKTAYLNGELYELFSKDNRYIYDNDGNLILGQDRTCNDFVDEKFDFQRLLMLGGQNFCYGLNRKEREALKADMVVAVNKLIFSEDITQIFDACQIYFVLAAKEDDDFFIFKGVSEKFYDALVKAIMQHLDEFKMISLEGNECGNTDYDFILFNDEKLVNHKRRILS